MQTNTRLTTLAESAALDAVVVKGGKNKDQRGRDRVYTREIVNLYKGREEVETVKGNTVSDLLSGMVGVYSGDARNSGAIDPNIRGVQGQGRIPVTVDGTEQAITVWRGYAGANNRNYVDPNIISSVIARAYRAADVYSLSANDADKALAQLQRKKARLEAEVYAAENPPPSRAKESDDDEIPV